MLLLLTDPWLPLKDSKGRWRRLPPRDILNDDIVDLAWSRADFQGACYQGLIGLLQATVAPEDRAAWEDVWADGLDTKRWAEQLAVLAPAFHFGAEKPSFMQDMDTLDSEALPIANLLIDAPGGNTLKLNKDHFVKRDTVKHLCPACAAMALFTLQTNAPSGGQGHRVGLRGGGPLTTLVWPKDPNTPLWRRLWLNVLTQEQMPPSKKPIDVARFPWCGPTRTSEKANGMTTPNMVDQQQAYWGMPRRIELDFSEPTTGTCDLCGEASEALLSHYRSKNYGTQYVGWTHPLTPYRRDIKDPTAPMLSVKGQSGGLLYKDWLGLLWQGQSERNLEFPATVVQQAAEFLPGGIELGLNCFGFDMDNMKARCWYQHELPLRYLDTPALHDEFFSWLRQAVLAAADGVWHLKNAIKAAWFGSPKDARGSFDTIDQSFWQETEAAFIDLINALQTGFSHDPKDLSALYEWRRFLHREFLRRFDDLVFSNPEQRQDLSREITARKGLYAALNKSAALNALKEPT